METPTAIAGMHCNLHHHHHQHPPLLLLTWNSFSSWHRQVWRQHAAQSDHSVCQLCAEASTSSPTSMSPNSRCLLPRYLAGIVCRLLYLQHGKGCMLGGDEQAGADLPPAPSAASRDSGGSGAGVVAHCARHAAHNSPLRCCCCWRREGAAAQQNRRESERGATAAWPCGLSERLVWRQCSAMRAHHSVGTGGLGVR